MANEDKGKWVTIKGTPVFIKEGQSLSQAFANRKKFTKDGKPKGKAKQEEALITKDKGNNWRSGDYKGYHVTAKVFEEPSEFGIRNGKVSKLTITKDGETYANYDRGWDVKPKDKKLLNDVVKQLENPKSGYEQFLANENGLKIGKGQENILEHDLKKQAVKYKEDPTKKNLQKYNKRREDVLDYEHKKEGKIAKEFNGRYRESEYGDRYYNDETIKTPLNVLTASLNKSYEDIDADFKSRIEDGNIEIYDANEVIGSNWSSRLDPYVQEIFGEGAFLEPIDSVGMNVAGVYVEKANRWQDTWAKENGKSAQDMARIERAVEMYELGDFGEDELKDYFKDWQEMRSYQYNKARDERRNAFFSKDAYSKENMKKKDEIIAKEKWGDYDSTFGQIARDSALPIFQMDNSDSLKKQLENFQEHVKNGDGHNKENLEDTITRLKNLNSDSLTAQFLEYGSGEISESEARKEYGDAKVDTALLLENQLMAKGYNNVYTSLEPGGVVADSNYTDMTIRGNMPEKNLSITYNFNDKGEAVISLEGMEAPGIYGTLILNDKNLREIRDITSGSSIGGYPEFKEYYKPREPKLTSAEKEEYYGKLNDYYKEHYNDGYDAYAKQVREDIVKRRG